MGRRAVSNPLALAVLGLLQEQPMHPYEMATTLRSRHKGGSFKISTGSLYDTVAALARHAWIEPVETARTGGRPERTVYRHTDLGQREFVAWIDEIIRTPLDEFPRFVAAVSYLGALGPTRAAEALTERASQLTRRIAESRDVLDQTVGAGITPRLFMIEVEYAAHAWAAELDWTQRTIAEIRDGTLAWPQISGWTSRS